MRTLKLSALALTLAIMPGVAQAGAESAGMPSVMRHMTGIPHAPMTGMPHGPMMPMPHGPKMGMPMPHGPVTGMP